MFSRLLKNVQVQGARGPRREAYPSVRRSNKDKGNAADGRFSAAGYNSNPMADATV